jgi:LPS-assembly protein
MRKFYNMSLRLTLPFLALIIPSLSYGQICTPPMRQSLVNPFFDNDIQSISLTNELNISASFIDLARLDGSDYFEDITIKLGDKLLFAENASYFPQEGVAQVAGNVIYGDSQIYIASEYAEINTLNEEISFTETSFDLLNPPAYGRAGALKVDRLSIISISDAFFSTCGEDNPFWSITSATLDLNPLAGTGKARKLSLRIKGVPLLYLPSLTFPISNKRKSGFLMPEFNNSQKLGKSMSFPFYFNIAPYLDMVLSPGYHTKKGSNIDSQIRYINPLGGLNGSLYYVSDSTYDNPRRYAGAMNLDFRFPNRIALTGSGRILSDSFFYEDFLHTREFSSETHYINSLSIAGGNDNIRFSAGIEGIHYLNDTIQNQNTDSTIVKISPLLMVEGFKSLGSFFIESHSELAQFESNEKILRFDSVQSIELPFNIAGINFNPRASIRYTSYNKDEGRISRTIPTVSLDSKMVFKRSFTNEPRYTQTLEPRLMYIWSPNDDEQELPFFDTLMPDLSITNLFNPYRYVGPDRALSRDDWIFGATSRIIDTAKGREILSGTAAIARRDSLSLNRNDELKDTLGNDYIIEINSQITSLIRAQVSRRWNQDDASIKDLLTRIIYTPEENILLSMGYTKRSSLINQLNTTIILPLFKGDFYAKLAYSIKDKDVLENRFGWQYNGCCWGLGFEYYDYVGRHSGEHDQGFKVQFFLNGLMNNRINSIDSIIRGGLLQ